MAAGTPQSHVPCEQNRRSQVQNRRGLERSLPFLGSALEKGSRTQDDISTDRSTAPRDLGSIGGPGCQMRTRDLHIKIEDARERGRLTEADLQIGKRKHHVYFRCNDLAIAGQAETFVTP